MAENSELERTEPASPRRLQQAREEGQVPRSRELSAFAVLAVAAVTLWALGRELTHRLATGLSAGLAFDRDQAIDSELMLPRLAEQFFNAFATLAPLFGLLFIAALVSPLLLNGWVWSLKPLAPNLGRLNPAKGLARIFSLTGLAELGKALAKAVLVGSAAAFLIWRNKEEILALIAVDPASAVTGVGGLLGLIFVLLTGVMFLIAAVDVPLQIWDHRRKLRMSREELRREAKESEGDPQVKARIRSLQRERARRRMMEDVPKADVIVTNPTHYAVALSYREAGMRAPKVVAKGSQLVAARIREIAEAHRVPVLSAPPLARALYHHADIGDEIPEALYRAVAEVLAYVFQLRRHREYGGAAPRPPQQLPVPAELDPEQRPK